MTPEQAMEMLKDIQGMMSKAEELLNDGSRGKALETEEELMRRLEQELGATEAQKKILEKVRKLTERSEKKQKDAVDKLAEVIRKAKAQSGNGQSKDQQQKKDGQSSKAQNPSSPAQSPYDPNRNDPPSKFRSKADKTGSWGNLPEKVRDAMLHGKRDVDEYPAEFSELLKEYMRQLSGEDK
jgi:uncharacterized protein with von Willebrand factor type A (vWA) domain